MTIEEFGSICGLKLEYVWHSANRVTVSFKNVEVRNGNTLISMYGDASTADKAREAYANFIKGQLLVHKAFTKEQREFRAPKTWNNELDESKLALGKWLAADSGRYFDREWNALGQMQYVLHSMCEDSANPNFEYCRSDECTSNEAQAIRSALQNFYSRFPDYP